MLYALARAEGKPLTRERVYREVWGYEMMRGDRSVDVFVRKVRQKLAAARPGPQLRRRRTTASATASSRPRPPSEVVEEPA